MMTVPLRVLHIGKFFPPAPGGIENFTGDLLPELHAQGVEVGALVHQGSEKYGPSPDSSLPFSIKRVPCFGNIIYAQVSPSFPFVLQKSLSSFKPDILHLHMPNTSALWVLMLPQAKKIPWVIHWHADVVPSAIEKKLALAYRLYRPFENALLTKATRVIVTSDAYLETSETLRPFINKCTVIPLGLSPERFKNPEELPMRTALKEWGSAENFTKILVLGRLTYYKGIEYLLEAVTQTPKIRLVIIGTGSEENRLHNLVSRLHLDDRVTMTGYLPDSQVQAYLFSCDWLCLPSIERTEAFGLVLLEAMQHKKPVIASDILGSGVGWVVKHKETGILVPPENTKKLASVLAAISCNEIQGDLLGKSGKTRLYEHFHIKKIASEIKDLYMHIAGR